MRKSIIAVVAAALFIAVLAPSAHAAGRANPDDIDGDGKGDLLVGVPLESVGAVEGAGSVNVIFSGGKRLVASGNVSLTETSLGGAAAAGHHFGSAVELADVDGDGHADAVIGVSGATVQGARQAGQVLVVPGTRRGLDQTGVVRLSQGSELVGTPEADDFLGFRIVAGNFNGDAFADVAVSAPFEAIEGHAEAGAVVVVPGGARGLDIGRAVKLTQVGAGGPEPGDTFGWAMTVGDFDGDGRDDLAVGAPGEDGRSIANSGAVSVYYGSRTGLDASRARSFSQAGKIKERRERNDLFGFAVAASDLDCDGDDDLLVGVPNEGVRDVDPAGYVNIIEGSAKGLRKKGNGRLHQRSGRVAGSLDFNQFGAALAGGDFDGDGCGDVAIGAHTTDVGGDGLTFCGSDRRCRSEAGAVVAVYGDRRWPRTGGTAQFTQRGQVPGKPQPGDFFGRTLAVVDIDGDGRDDLVVGAPGEDLRGRRDAGTITVLRGRASGLSAVNSYVLSQAGRIKGVPEAGDQFAAALFDASS